MAKLSGEDRLSYLQMEIGQGLRTEGKKVSSLTLKTEREDGELEMKEAD